MASFWEVLRVPAPGDFLDDMMTYVSQPSEPGERPAVIVIQEAFGINKNIQNVADRFASGGYVAAAPAMFHREGSTEEIRGTNPVYDYGDMDNVRRAMGDLRDEQIILDINTTIEWLRKNPRVTGDRIGIVGFCAGGRITYLAAAACPGLSAAVVFYGGNTMRSWGEGPTPFDLTANVQCPVMGNFGELDQNPSVDDVRKIEVELHKSGKTSDFKIFPGAGHGFFCDERADYREEAAKDAWARSLAWFQKHLAPVATTA